MDFFQHQDRARRKTGVLVAYFVIAVVLIVLAVYVVVVLILNLGASQGPRAYGGRPDLLDRFLNPTLFLPIAGGTVALIGLVSLFKIGSLKSGGGAGVAQMLGGRLLNPSTRDFHERRLLNVVEEMAIASGTPVPPVYVLEQEEGINAFAAGFQPGDAVIGVTRGTMQRLSRDELQGVIAHEFSHILNGDMRLNLRLIGILAGILFLTIIGCVLMQAARGSRYSSRRGRDGGAGAIVLLGVALFVIGLIGMFFARLIQAAVSRQREYLADASAVQFTRNPSGIAGALKKIGGLAQGSRVENAHAEEASHMFFGDAVRNRFSNLMATHPPLVERIRRIEPSFDGRFPEVPASETREEFEAQEAEERRHRAVVSGLAEPSRARPRPPVPVEPAEVASRVGAPRAADVDYATAIVASLPDPLAEQVRSPLGASSVVHALLLSDQPAVREQQLSILAHQAPPALYAEVRRVEPMVRDLPREMRLPLVEMAMPTLRGLSPRQFADLATTLRALVVADQKVTLFEYVVERLLREQLGRSFQPLLPTARRRRDERSALPQASAALLSTLAYVGDRAGEGAARAFAAGSARLGLANHMAMLPPEQCGLDCVDRALASLQDARPAFKKRLIEACTATIAVDGRVNAEEAELLRAVALALECPMPPLTGLGAAARTAGASGRSS